MNPYTAQPRPPMQVQQNTITGLTVGPPPGAANAGAVPAFAPQIIHGSPTQQQFDQMAQSVTQLTQAMAQMANQITALGQRMSAMQAAPAPALGARTAPEVIAQAPPTTMATLRTQALTRIADVVAWHHEMTSRLVTEEIRRNPEIVLTNPNWLRGDYSSLLSPATPPAATIPPAALTVPPAPQAPAAVHVPPPAPVAARPAPVRRLAGHAQPRVLNQANPHQPANEAPAGNHPARLERRDSTMVPYLDSLLAELDAPKPAAHKPESARGPAHEEGADSSAPMVVRPRKQKQTVVQPEYTRQALKAELHTLETPEDVILNPGKFSGHPATKPVTDAQPGSTPEPKRPGDNVFNTWVADTRAAQRRNDEFYAEVERRAMTTTVDKARPDPERQIADAFESFGKSADKLVRQESGQAGPVADSDAQAPIVKNKSFDTGAEETLSSLRDQLVKLEETERENGSVRSKAVAPVVRNGDQVPDHIQQVDEARDRFYTQIEQIAEQNRQDVPVQPLARRNTR